MLESLSVYSLRRFGPGTESDFESCFILLLLLRRVGYLVVGCFEGVGTPVSFVCCYSDSPFSIDRVYCGQCIFCQL